MPRQNFLSRESFVEATEVQAKESILSVPVFVQNIKLIAENEHLQSYKFRYQIPLKNLEYHVDVTVLPLDFQYTRISLHGEHSNGQAFENDFEMATIHLSAQDFKDKVFDYEADQEWKYKGDKSAIIDFYADWCGPCKSIAPVLEELSEQYKDDLVIYKIDTDKEAELSSLFGIQSIPTLLFIPMNGNPMVQKGALPKNILQQIIEERLLQHVEIKK